ncbi:MAG: chromate efflux transporter [Candidatus Sumerlaeia bacterium]|nr:chromate efflux transporter [Candidatus Sumerlaeia bacterium]
MTLPTPSVHDVTYREALRVWVRVALMSFGGPAGQIAVMHRLLVEEKRWVSENRFLHALNYCMLLPGPEAQQLATYIGWLLHGTRGGLTAGLLFVLPGFLSILALSVIYATMQDAPLVQGLFFGLKAAILAVVVAAVVRIGRKALKNSTMVTLAALAFVGIFFLRLPFPAIVLGAGVVGLAGGRWRPKVFQVLEPHGAASGGDDVAIRDGGASARPSLRRSVLVGAGWLAIWLAPVAALIALLGEDHVLAEEAVFFSKAATVTFGGAYSVLAYIAQQAVQAYGWLAPGEMLDGLGMAETTPGPLIQVVQFVGFMGAWRNPEPFSPMTAALLGSVVTTWVTFAPCFLWIFLGAPYIEYLRGNRILTSALSAITAAVVGVILNLALWFGIHVLFAEVAERRLGPIHASVPEVTSLDPAVLAISVLAFVALFRLKWDVLRVLAVAAAVGVAWGMIVGI